jgi:GNAT superfamily N-acetyltransferase
MENMTMNLIYKKASIDNIDVLTETRIKVLKAANKLPENTDMSDVKRCSYDYYKKALGDDTHIAYLVFDENRFVGSGGICFFQVMPTYHNPSGKKAYIMNMYTDPAYRRRGIAYQTLDKLVKTAKSKEITSISLEATPMGRPLYEKYGFVKMNDEMELQLRN